MPEKSRDPDETWAESDLFDWIAHGSQSDSKDHYYKRVGGLEELKRRVITNSLQNTERATEILLNVAENFGEHQPESSLVVDTFILLIEKDGRVFDRVLDGLGGYPEKTFLCLSKLVPRLDREKKRKSIRHLVSFLMSRDVINAPGVDEVHKCLVTMDGEIHGEILRLIAPNLRSLRMTEVVLTARICSEVGNATITSQMLKVSERSLAHYYGDHEREIQEKLCTFFKRVPDKRSLSFILKIAQLHPSTRVSDALARVVDAHPEGLEEIYQSLEKAEDPQNILIALTKVKKVSVDFDRVLDLTIKNLGNLSISYYLKTIALKAGESAKPTLLRLAKSEDSIEYEFAISCLNEMGVALNEIAAIFDENIIIQVYETLSERNPKWSLDRIWNDRAGLTDNARGDKLEYFVQNMLSAFNFATLFVDPTNYEGIDIVAFSPDSLHIYIVGCTTGTPTDDIPKLRSTITELKQKLPGFFAKYRVVPVIFTSRETNSKYSDAEGMVILTPSKIDKILEMLRTGRTSNDLNQYILQNVIQAPIRGLRRG